MLCRGWEGNNGMIEVDTNCKIIPQVCNAEIFNEKQENLGIFYE
ncbi:hypothetical protein RintRC_6291 [Richelia intracellularis]|nr:hypothetical protein RintRC_6291 [Richelia intracellularis]